MSTGSYVKNYTASNGLRASISITTGDDEEANAVISKNYDNVTPEPVNFGSLSDEMAYYGFSQDFINNVNSKINDVNNTNPIAEPVTISNGNGGFFQSSKGSIVSNSAQSLKNNTQYQKARLELEQVKVKSMNVQNELLKKQLEMNEFVLVSQSQLNKEIVDLNKNIKAQTQAIIAQKIDLKVEGGMNANLNLDITPLAQSNAIIASGVENQIATNAKIIETLTKKNIDLDNKKENYEFLKDGLPSLKDSKGNIIKPRESQALKSAEDSILTKDKNTFDSQSNIIDTLSSVLNDEESKNSGTSSGFGDFELKDILGKILNVDLEKFDSEYASNLYQPKGANNGN